MSSSAFDDMSRRSHSKATLHQPSAAWKAFVGLVGASLAAERKARGMTQQYVAEKLGVEPESISRMESGVIVPTLQRLRQFADLYGCSMVSLIARSSDQASDVASRLTKELSTLQAADRMFVAEHTQALIEYLRMNRTRKG